jgi:NADH dehydrogenase
LALLACQLVGWAVRDVVLTREEIEGLMAGLLVSQKPPTGWTRMSDWVRAHASTLGTKYSSEVARHFA